MPPKDAGHRAAVAAAVGPAASRLRDDLRLPAGAAAAQGHAAMVEDLENEDDIKMYSITPEMKAHMRWFVEYKLLSRQNQIDRRQDQGNFQWPSPAAFYLQFLTKTREVMDSFQTDASRMVQDVGLLTTDDIYVIWTMLVYNRGHTFPDMDLAPRKKNFVRMTVADVIKKFTPPEGRSYDHVLSSLVERVNKAVDWGKSLKKHNSDMKKPGVGDYCVLEWHRPGSRPASHWLRNGITIAVEWK
jgi:hypothetical protein